MSKFTNPLQKQIDAKADDLDKARQFLAALEQKIADTTNSDFEAANQREIDRINGLEALGRATDVDIKERSKRVQKVAAYHAEINSLTSQRYGVLMAIAADEADLVRLRSELHSQGQASLNAQADALLDEFFAKAADLAQLVARLIILERSLDDKLFASFASFSMPKVYKHRTSHDVEIGYFGSDYPGVNSSFVATHTLSSVIAKLENSK